MSTMKTVAILLSSAAVLSWAKHPLDGQNCTTRRQVGFKCYEDLFGDTVNPVKGQYMSAAVSDEDFGRAIITQWAAMVDAFDICRKVDAKFDACAGPTPNVPEIADADLSAFVHAKFECMSSGVDHPTVEQAMERLKLDSEKCFQEQLPQDLCMANDDVISCYQTELVDLMKQRLESKDPGTIQMIRVFQQTKEHFSGSSDDSGSDLSLMQMCSECYKMISPDCMPEPRPLLADEKREFEVFSCIGAFKSKKVEAFNQVFSQCMSEQGFKVDGHSTAIIPEPRKWLALCMGMDAE